MSAKPLPIPNLKRDEGYFRIAPKVFKPSILDAYYPPRQNPKAKP